MANIGNSGGGMSFPGPQGEGWAGRSSGGGYKTAAPEVGSEHRAPHYDAPTAAPEVGRESRAPNYDAPEPIGADVMRVTFTVPRDRRDDVISSLAAFGPISKVEIFNGSSWDEVAR